MRRRSGALGRRGAVGDLLYEPRMATIALKVALELIRVTPFNASVSTGRHTHVRHELDGSLTLVTIVSGGRRVAVPHRDRESTSDRAIEEKAAEKVSEVELVVYVTATYTALTAARRAELRFKRNLIIFQNNTRRPLYAYREN